MINNFKKLPGGIGDRTPTDKVDAVQLSLGVQIEMEHTNDPEIAKEIAMDHLTEDPEYYLKLIKAGLAKEFKPTSGGSGLGDPHQSFNDKARVGKSGLKPGNMHGTIGNTSDGKVHGRKSNPIIDKSLSFENIMNEISTSQLKSYDGYVEFRSKVDGRDYEVDFKNGTIQSIVDTQDNSVEFNVEKANELFNNNENLSNIIDMSKMNPQSLNEKKKKPKPTNPALWSRVKSLARSKFDVYPSAYANGWAAREYKKRGGGWRMGECTGTNECGCGCKESVIGQTFSTPDAGELAQGGVGNGMVGTAGSGYDLVGYAENKESKIKSIIKNIVREVLAEIKGVPGTHVPGTTDEAKGKKWIQKAIDPTKKGSLKKALGVGKGKKIPLDKLKAAAKKGGKVGQRARLAMTLRKLK